MVDVQDGSADWRERLRDRGFRLTAQRELVLDAVRRLGHATPDDVVREVADEGVNVSTVYRTLEVLEEVGLVRHTHLSDRAPTYHSTTGHTHFHLVCRKCSAVTSVGTDVAAALVDTLHSEHGFDADVGHLAVFGTCVDCEEPTS